MKTHRLSKSDFKLGCECPFKLKYKKSGYPSSLVNNEALDFFAEGGFMVEAIAHAVMEGNPRVEFEKTIQSGPYLARIDGFEHFSDHIVLTEIKAKSVVNADLDQFFKGNGTEIKKSWRPYLLDITFQVMVAQRVYENMSIVPKLCVVNKNKHSNIESIFAKIELQERGPNQDFGLPRAVYMGDKDALRSDHFLEFIDVGPCVDFLMPEVEASAHELVEFLDGNRPNLQPNLGLAPCKKCEYRDVDLVRNGFRDCWGTTPPRGEHVIDLYRAGNGTNELLSEISERIQSRSFRLTDLPDDLLSGQDSHSVPRRNQKKALLDGGEVIDARLAQKLANLEYPLYFIDFEASRIPVPYLPGMKPFQQVAFQFSCHRVDTPQSEVAVHSEWLNLKDTYPNEEFARELRKVIRNSGTVLVWSHYEESTLESVRLQLSEHGVLDSELSSWFDSLIGPMYPQGKKNKLGSPHRIVDLLDLALAFYCHPNMKGSFSIKKVLDSIWADADFLWTHPWFVKYYKQGSDGLPLDPYKTLKSDPISEVLGEDEDDEEEVGGGGVTDGVGAMRAYQSLLYGARRGDKHYRESLASALHRYCELDTAAMLIIWLYWCSKTGVDSPASYTRQSPPMQLSAIQTLRHWLSDKLRRQSK